MAVDLYVDAHDGDGIAYVHDPVYLAKPLLNLAKVQFVASVTLY